MEPAHQQKEYGKGIQSTEDLLVVSRQPFWQVDVKVRPPIIGVTRSDSRQRALHSVQHEDTNFAGDDGCEKCSEAET